MSKKNQPSQVNPASSPLDTVFPWLLPILLFFSITATSRLFSVVAAVICLVLTIGRGPAANLRQRLSPLTIAVFLYALICLLSGLWCHFGSYAARESAKTLTALSLFGVLLARVKRENIRGLLSALDGALALVGLLCIDGSSLQMLVRAFSKVMALFSAGYPLESMGYESGVRITGIFNNANVSAGLLAIGLVVSLYLLRTAETERGRLLVSVGLGIQALAFFLSFSMGAMAAFGLTCLVYVACSAKGSRLPLFLLMMECVVVTVACSVAATPFLGTVSPVPVVLGPVCGLLIWALDRFVGSRLLSALAGRDRAVAITGGVLAVLAVAYVLLAFNMTGGITLDPDSTLSRAVYPDAGSYTVAYDGVDAQAVIYSQDESQLMMHTNTVLYKGPLSGASFTVPESSRVVWFQLTGEGRLESVTLSDGTALPLGYKLLPTFAANRLQGLWANQNFIQRLVFFRDGIRLWLASPLIGWGVGGVEGQLTAVQSFYYESKYIHNQFIQILDEAGILGLAAFVGMLGSAAWLLLRRRKTDTDPLLPMLAACLTMMTAHSLTEVVWSTQIYQAAVFTIFVALILHCWEPDRLPRSKASGPLALAALWCVVVVFGGLMGGHLLAARELKNLDTEDMTVTEFMAAMQRLDKLDVYDDSDYKVNLMANALQTNSATSRGVAARCARELRATNEYDACYHLAAYYYLPLRDMDGFFEAVQAGLAQERSNPDAWNSAFHLYQQVVGQLEEEYIEDFIAGVLSTGELMDEANAVLMAPAELDEGNQKLLDCVRSLEDADPTEAQVILSLVVGQS